ncbi:bifunctional riboflavin kinase/FAD synthetase [Sporosarcina sp. Te-1]|uniref:bifunctional riboflavin kinase/FAD synthetase n=1 Tax=Sporosarcina sp. Te-1 TaxID=2818390 RepID=UPI001A9CCC91|nr:bifunctional riboflavin kinase/FAD synthetase [Sporosarcina sp. Te-1]QTD42283.1 bifunctional riboflavin kinase/FAD synthetase [Sporosarcina sp. Te-1]
MEIFELNYPNHTTIDRTNEYSLAIGFFDGLHKGHQQVINSAVQKAAALGIRSAVMTFNPHPSHLFREGKDKVGYITPFDEKVKVLETLGVDALFIVRFDWELASLSPEQFIDIFIKDLHVKHVTAGFDFTFGSKGAGTMEQMALLSDGSFGTTVIDKVEDEDAKISSTRIRSLLAEGNVEKTAQLLGRPFRTTGEVIHGEKRGRLLGFPTANIETDDETILPKNGVYAVLFTVDAKKHFGVCNVGIKPTFKQPDEMKPLIEVHVLDYEGDLYGQLATVDWIAHIREEQKFASVDELVGQIGRDKETARSILQQSIL